MWLLIAGLVMGWARARLLWCLAVAAANAALGTYLQATQGNDWRRVVGVPTYDTGTIALNAILSSLILFGVTYAVGRGVRRWLKP